MKISIPLTKMKKPITLNLTFFNKNSKKAKKFQLLKHYNYGFIQEYQFSPSNSPLILRHKRRYSANLGRKETKGRDFQSMLFMCKCFGGGFRAEARDDVYSMENCHVIEEELEMCELGVSEDGLSSVDEKADEFIQKFYAQMRMQSHEF
ncbi:uncharacterized protein LOC141598941 [Silene latifolia]|uniref:uncharacterized protein LOC141598941 n=1 Tax=Silene latifolia TaxID=37657 RepID=UPI003D7769B3